MLWRVEWNSRTSVACLPREHDRILARLLWHISMSVRGTVSERVVDATRYMTRIGELAEAWGSNSVTVNTNADGKNVIQGRQRSEIWCMKSDYYDNQYSAFPGSLGSQMLESCSECNQLSLQLTEWYAWEGCNPTPTAEKILQKRSAATDEDLGPVNALGPFCLSIEDVTPCLVVAWWSCGWRSNLTFRPRQMVDTEGH